ncbi:MAG: SDR family NAD(P)-dependent oxidoreductase [Proteobacteria bacterium]|nr:SDR family NAD(P)-dependent oxidoreductase [Pseudomonadota bacterium]
MKKIWLVGASEGIGRDLAIKLAKDGNVLALSARSKERIDSLITELSGSGHINIPLDASNMASITAAWEKIVAEFKNLDTVIYNAGFYLPNALENLDLTAIEKMHDVNFTGAIRVLSQCLPHFLQNDSGHIAVVGSVAGYSGLPNALGYASSKAALINFLESMKCDLKGRNIKLQIINPGFVKTRLTQQNSFKMPFLIPSEEAAEHIVSGLKKNCFEIHFPWQFSYFLKFLRLLPYSLYFKIISKTK